MIAHEAFIGEPPRVAKLRRELIKAIPCIPNDAAALAQMRQKPIGEITIDYVNWISRYVVPRPRQVSVVTLALSDPQWVLQENIIRKLLTKVERGDDLTPYLSLKPHSRGYNAASFVPGGPAEQKWRDKDFLLTTTGCYHFHLEAALTPKGFIERSDDMLFAQVTRDSFTVLGIFTHEVFTLSSPEHLRLCAVHNAIRPKGPPGVVTIGTMITQSGHDLRSVYYAGHCAREIITLDPELDDPAAIKQRFVQTDRQMPKHVRFRWKFYGLDLCIQEDVSKTIWWVQKGWI